MEHVPFVTLGYFTALFMAGLIGLLLTKTILNLRTVVSTNDVHIVQTGKRTTSYGKDQAAGNVYYAWPEWLPFWGCKVIVLPVSVFNVDLDEYAAYDKGRVPFVVDIMAFFRIKDSDTAAQRVNSFEELEKQLEGILQGATRSILAKSDIEDILEERAMFGQKFTDAVKDQLVAWGVSNVKSIELMDVRDAHGSKVIENIMAKKKSLIEMQSRVEVAENQRRAQEAEIAAQQEVEIKKQEAIKQVGIRTAEQKRDVGIADAAQAQAVGVASEQAKQATQEQAKVTAEKDMAVRQVQEVRKAEIARDVAVVAAEQDRQVIVVKAQADKAQAIVRAEGDKAAAVTIAEGAKDAALLHAQGVKANGEAQGAADTAIAMAPVNAQTALAREIGSNVGYQDYLVRVRVLEKEQAVGVAQAAAMEKANIKVIANTGSNTGSGLGTAIAAALEGIVQSPVGEAVVNKLVSPKGAKS